MGQITTGVGLISGLDIAGIVDQLMAIEARPRTLIQQRNSVLTSQQVALQSVNANLLSLKQSATGFLSKTTFNSTATAVSDETVLTATGTGSALPGTYDFTVARLVSSQQMITRGYSDTGGTAIAPAGGTLTFEFGDARLDSDTELSQLNGGEGITRGKIRVTDRTGASSVVDLSKATTVDDVLEAINGAENVNVTASVSGDGFLLTDNTGSTTTNLVVSDVNNSGTATTLGLSTAAVGNTLTGTDINQLSDDLQLAQLNDGNGVRTVSSQPDFQLATRDGNTFGVDISTAASIGEVIAAIDTASAGAVTATVNGAGLQLTDNTAGGSTFAVTALNSSNAAADLGILQTDGNADGIIEGSRVLASMNSRLIGALNGGSGVTTGTIDVTNRLGATSSIDLSAAESVSDIINTINDAGAGVTATLNNAGNGLLLTDTTGGTASDLIVADVSGTTALDLNLVGSFAADAVDSGNLQRQYVTEATTLASLRGGQGVTSGKFRITDSNGASATVDLTQGNEVAISDVISEINSRGLAINARINVIGDGILIEDTGAGAVALLIEEDGSSTAADLGLLGEAANPGENLNGSFETTVTIEATDTLDSIRDKINDAGIGASATIINDGSSVNPFRLSINADEQGKAGAFVFDDGGIGLKAQTLNKAQNALVFYGSSDPAKGFAITSTTNTLKSVVPGVTIDLKNTSDSAVRVSVSRDDAAAGDSVQTFVDDFNSVISSINAQDFFDSETLERGLLFGDPTTSQIKSSLFRIINSRTGDLSSQFTSLAQVGVTVGSGATLKFDAAKFQAALETDRDAVEALFTFKETETDPVTNNTTLTASGIGARIEQLLGNLTDVVLQGRVDAIGSQIKGNEDRIESLNDRLASKRARLEAQFIAMESTLAQLQGQSGALAGLQNLAAQSR